MRRVSTSTAAKVPAKPAGCGFFCTVTDSAKSTGTESISGCDHTPDSRGAPSMYILISPPGRAVPKPRT